MAETPTCVHMHTHTYPPPLLWQSTRSWKMDQATEVDLYSQRTELICKMNIKE